MKRSRGEWLLSHSGNPVIRAVSRGLYYAGLMVLSHGVLRSKGVVALYLRRGMTRGDWVPGGSDYDLTAVLDDQADESLSQALQVKLKNFSRAWPIPVDLEIFKEAELAAYLEQGNARSMEAPLGWKRLWGRRLVSIAPRSPFEIALHCFSEALEQYTRLTTIILNGASNRKEVRKLINAFSDVIFYAEFASQGMISSFPARPGGLKGRLTRPAELALEERLEVSVRGGFGSIEEKTQIEMLEIALRHLHSASESTLLRSVEAAWVRVSPRPITSQLSAQKEFWISGNAKAKSQGISLKHLHFQDGAFLVVVKAKGAVAPASLKLLKGYRRLPKAILVTDSVLRVLSATFYHQKSAADGVRLSVDEREPLEWIASRATEAARVSLRAKHAGSPSDKRRAAFTTRSPALSEI